MLTKIFSPMVGQAQAVYNRSKDLLATDFKRTLAASFASIKQGELASMNSVVSTQDPLITMKALNDAEIALNTFMATRDRVVQSYQEIMRMAI